LAARRSISTFAEPPLNLSAGFYLFAGEMHFSLLFFFF